MERGRDKAPALLRVPLLLRLDRIPAQRVNAVEPAGVEGAIKRGVGGEVARDPLAPYEIDRLQEAGAQFISLPADQEEGGLRGHAEQPAFGAHGGRAERKQQPPTVRKLVDPGFSRV